MPRQKKTPFNEFPGEFNPPTHRNIQKNKPCYDKCRVQCPVPPQPKYLTSKEPFGNIQSYDTGTDYYSLLDQ